MFGQLTDHIHKQSVCSRSTLAFRLAYGGSKNSLSMFKIIVIDHPMCIRESLYEHKACMENVPEACAKQLCIQRSISRVLNSFGKPGQHSGSIRSILKAYWKHSVIHWGKRIRRDIRPVFKKITPLSYTESKRNVIWASLMPHYYICLLQNYEIFLYEIKI